MRPRVTVVESGYFFLNHPYGIGIFIAREALATALSTIEHAIMVAPEGTCIDVLVNGNASLATDIRAQVETATTMPGKSIRLWHIKLGDKANAWNQYIHRIWRGEEIAFFIDGYVLPEGGAFASLRDRLAEDDHALGATGTPAAGSSGNKLRQQMLASGGYHGNLCCMRGEVVARLAELDIWLPLGMYRVDGLVAALLCFNLDPANNQWDIKRIAVDPDANWKVADDRVFSLRYLQGQFKRRLRQAKGSLENRAIQEHLETRKLSPAAFPRTGRELVLNWVAEHPNAAADLRRRHPLRRYALRQLSVARDFSGADKAPELIFRKKG